MNKYATIRDPAGRDARSGRVPARRGQWDPGASEPAGRRGGERARRGCGSGVRDALRRRPSRPHLRGRRDPGLDRSGLSAPVVPQRGDRRVRGLRHRHRHGDRARGWASRSSSPIPRSTRSVAGAWADPLGHERGLDHGDNRDGKRCWTSHSRTTSRRPRCRSEDSDFQSLDDLAGQVICVAEQTTYLFWIGGRWRSPSPRVRSPLRRKASPPPPSRPMSTVPRPGGPAGPRTSRAGCGAAERHRPLSTPATIPSGWSGTQSSTSRSPSGSTRRSRTTTRWSRPSTPSLARCTRTARSPASPTSGTRVSTTPSGVSRATRD